MHPAASEELIGIGAFAALTGLSIDALRHYHEVGVLTPAEVEPRSNYRRYALSQATRAMRIAALRAADVPLRHIRLVLDAASPSHARDVLTAHRCRLTERARETARSIELLDALIEEELQTVTHMSNQLREELLSMFNEQQVNSRAMFEATRAQRPDRFLFEIPESERPPGYREGAEMNHRHATRLAEIVEEYGWPGRAVAGDDGAGAAWAIAQHADEDNELCKDWLAPLRRAVNAGDAPAMHFAALTDRVLLRDKLPQRYGTILEPAGSSWRPRDPVEDPDALDARRRELGLGTFGDWAGSLPSPDAWYEGEATA